MLMLLTLQRRVHQWDQRLFFRVSRWRTRRFGAGAFRLLSATGDGYWYGILALVITLSLQLSWQYFLTLALAFAIERPLYWVLKNSFKRDRPSAHALPVKALFNAHDRFSFPSGHTCAAFVFATVSALHFPDAAPLLWVWATAIGISRVAVGVHYPTDVVAGACLGTAIAEFTLFIIATYPLF